MNANKIHRLTIVDKQYKQYKFRQITNIQSIKNQTVARKNNLLKLVPQEQKKAA